MNGLQKLLVFIKNIGFECSPSAAVDNTSVISSRVPIPPGRHTKISDNSIIFFFLSRMFFVLITF